MLQPATIPGVGDSHGAFAAVYGTATRTSALSGCILRQYRSAGVVLSALFNDGVCIAVHSDEARLLASSTRDTAMATLLRGRHGWLLSASTCPAQMLEALDAAAAATSEMALSAG